MLNVPINNINLDYNMSIILLYRVHRNARKGFVSCDSPRVMQMQYLCALLGRTQFSINCFRLCDDNVSYTDDCYDDNIMIKTCDM